MADIYVRNADGSDADNGSTWALAKATLTGADAIDAPGDTLYLSSIHSQDQSSSLPLTFAGTYAAPTKIISVNDSTGVVENGAEVKVTGNFTTTLNGSLYVQGVTFRHGISNTSSASLTFASASSKIVLEGCSLRNESSGTSSTITFGNSASTIISIVELINTDISLNAAGARFSLGGQLLWRGGAYVPLTNQPTALFTLNQRSYGPSLVEGVDLSALPSTVNIVGNGNGTCSLMLRNCKLPASWSGSLVGVAITTPGFRVEMHNCDSADTNYRLWVEDYAGSIKSETTLVRTGGASDGVTGYSLKMTTTANANALVAPLVSPEIVIWNDDVGSSKTVTFEILHDSATNLTDGEIWIEVQYLGTSGVPLGSFVSDAKADVLATAADQTTSSETWTTTGMTNPNKQKLSVTFTPQEAGYFQAKVYLAKASKTVYICPKPTGS